MERAASINFMKARAWAKAITATLNHEVPPHLTFARASQNVPTVVVLLDTLTVPSADGVDKVYRHLKDILGVVTAL
jgi:hypothetical protein